MKKGRNNSKHCTPRELRNVCRTPSYEVTISTFSMSGASLGRVKTGLWLAPSASR